ncbi:putative S-acyltransferase [Platanthera zijinensis]|uniref:S-acyltransferase n=1 Tax=Platanthera zijinensis TaxID=2320716 RepID=A0AAP0BXB8_9ASPA
MTQAPKKTKILYRVWKGNNRFFCGGRCIFGPDVASVFLSVLLIIGPIITFCYQIISKIHNRAKLHEGDLIDGHHHLLSFPILIVTLIIMLSDLSFLLLTASRDPGIVPRNAQSMESSDTSDFNTPSMEWINGRTLHMKLPRTKDIIINGFSVKIKYCDTCLLYRPPRTSHCSVCNNCVQKFDHHCPWVGQCIGLRNYRFFFLFISTSTFLCIFIFTISLMNILQERKIYHSFLKLIVGEIISVILLMYAFLSVWFVGGLTIFHLYLICTNQTTYENFRYRYDKKDNPFNMGVLQNIKEVFFSRIAPSMNNFRARVLDEVVENRYFAPNMSADMASSFEKVDVETGSPIEGGDSMPIPDLLRKLDYKSTIENQSTNNERKDEALDHPALDNIQEYDHKGLRECEQICTEDDTIILDHIDHMIEDETVADSVFY